MNNTEIVVLDGYTLNPGDLSWEDLEKLGACQIHARSGSADVSERIGSAEIVLTNKTVLDRETIKSASCLKYIGVLATGYNVVDLDAATEADVIVTNIPTYGTDSVAQMAFALLLELTQRVGSHAASVRDGQWSECDDFCYWQHPLVELSGKTLGLVGLGRIGQVVARIALAFGMSVVAYDQGFDESPVDGVLLIGLDELFRSADAISLHCPLTNENVGFVDAERLSMMKDSAFLINTSRGGLINEMDLSAALNHGRIAGAGLDVLSTEPPHPDNPLLSASNCLVTPHIAWATHSARQRLMGIAVNNIRAFLAGEPVNIVN